MDPDGDFFVWRPGSWRMIWSLSWALANTTIQTGTQISGRQILKVVISPTLGGDLPVCGWYTVCFCVFYAMLAVVISDA